MPLNFTGSSIGTTSLRGGGNAHKELRWNLRKKLRVVVSVCFKSKGSVSEHRAARGRKGEGMIINGISVHSHTQGLLICFFRIHCFSTVVFIELKVMIKFP